MPTKVIDMIESMQLELIRTIMIVAGCMVALCIGLYVAHRLRYTRNLLNWFACYCALVMALTLGFLVWQAGWSQRGAMVLFAGVVVLEVIVCYVWRGESEPADPAPPADAAISGSEVKQE